MLIVQDAARTPSGTKGAVVAIGNFDGVHRGHHHVIGTAGRIARATGAPLAVLTFDPHPRCFFRKDGPALQITSFAQKLDLLEALGVDAVFALRFDAALAARTAEDFIRGILIDRLAVRQVVVGRDFRFGARRSGDTDLLRTKGEAAGQIAGFGVTLVAAQAHGLSVHSSTGIRDALERGDPEAAGRILGRPWTVRGRLERPAGASRADARLWIASYTALGAGQYRARLTAAGQTVDVVALARTSAYGGSQDAWLDLTIPGSPRSLQGRMADLALLDRLAVPLAPAAGQRAGQSRWNSPPATRLLEKNFLSEPFLGSETHHA